jgi:hypothetical protein
MENEKTFIDPLFERVEEYGKTSLELIKLKAVDKGVDVASTFISRSIVLVIVVMFVMALNIGVAFWLSDLLGKLYYGFFCVAGFYAFVAIVLYFFMHKRIKKSVGDLLISLMLN